ncbi:MAG: hypothetical protein ACTSVI_05380 [Promethearchaeota archaeon]
MKFDIDPENLHGSILTNNISRVNRNYLLKLFWEQSMFLMLIKKIPPPSKHPGKLDASFNLTIILVS